MLYSYYSQPVEKSRLRLYLVESKQLDKLMMLNVSQYLEEKIALIPSPFIGLSKENRLKN